MGEFDFSVWQPSLPFIRDGLLFTLRLTLVAMSGGIVIGTLLALARLSPVALLSRIAGGYVDLMRSIPLVLVILWFFLVIPFITGSPVGAETSAVITFTAFEAAFYCEIMRSGIQSVPRGQRDASLALGLTLPQAYRQVLLPQALRIVMPPLTSEFMNVFKNSSVAFAIGVLELTFQARQMQEDSEQGIETYLAVTLLYFICAFAANRGMAWIEARSRVPGLIARLG